MTKHIGFMVDKPKYKKSILCIIGLHRASRYMIERENGIDYFICKQCGKRYKIL